MGMNNIYYRFTHLASNDGVRDHAGAAAHEHHRPSPASKGRLRAVVARGLGHQRLRHVHGIARARWCVKQGVSKEAVQDAVRIAAVVHATAATLDGEDALAA